MTTGRPAHRGNAEFYQLARDVVEDLELHGMYRIATEEVLLGMCQRNPQFAVTHQEYLFKIGHGVPNPFEEKAGLSWIQGCYDSVQYVFTTKRQEGERIYESCRKPGSTSRYYVLLDKADDLEVDVLLHQYEQLLVGVKTSGSRLQLFKFHRDFILGVLLLKSNHLTEGMQWIKKAYDVYLQNYLKWAS